ncbi:MAG: LuxR C-terminal-related transcriptional regulator [Microbacterium sp.]
MSIAHDPRSPIALRPATSTPTPAVDQLTRREWDVLRLMAQGRSNRGISESLHLSERTVESHIAHIMTKLGVEPSPAEHRRVLTVLHALRATA